MRREFWLVAGVGAALLSALVLSFMGAFASCVGSYHFVVTAANIVTAFVIFYCFTWGGEDGDFSQRCVLQSETFYTLILFIWLTEAAFDLIFFVWASDTTTRLLYACDIFRLVLTGGVWSLHRVSAVVSPRVSPAVAVAAPSHLAIVIERLMVSHLYVDPPPSPPCSPWSVRSSPLPPPSSVRSSPMSLPLAVINMESESTPVEPF